MKKPFYKNPTFWLWLMFVVVIGSGVGLTAAKLQKQKLAEKAMQERLSNAASYAPYSFDDLLNEAAENPLAATQRLKGQLIRVRGYIRVIDENGRYAYLYRENGVSEWIHLEIACEGAKQQLAGVKIGDFVEAYIELESIGENAGSGNCYGVFPANPAR